MSYNDLSFLIDSYNRYSRYYPYAKTALRSLSNSIGSLSLGKRTRSGTIFSPYLGKSRRLNPDGVKIPFKLPTSTKPNLKAGATGTKTKTKSKKKSSKMMVGAGTYRGNFRRTRRVRRAKFPVCVKDERSITSTGGNCVYMGHHTHPLRYTLRAIAMAMVHKYFAQCGIHVKNWNHSVGMFIATGADTEFDVDCVVTMQGRGTGTSAAATNIIIGSTAAAGVTSFLDFADDIADGFCGLNSTTFTDTTITRVEWRATAVAAAVISSKVWDAQEVMITVKGTSILNIQNRTAAGDVGDNLQTTSIYANPLIGKHYTLTGNGMRIKDIAAGAGVQVDQLYCDTTTGLIGFGSNATGIPTNMRDVLKQPVSPNYFYNCKGSSKIRLEPGAIRKSSCSATVTKSLNSWIVGYYRQTFNSVATDEIPGLIWVPTGVSKYVGLEKVADMGSGNSVVLGAERDAIYQSKCYFRKKRVTPATNNAL